MQLGDLIIKIAEVGLIDWSGRVNLVESICDVILLCPNVGEVRATHTCMYLL